MTDPDSEALADFERIYLQPECCADPDRGRFWCEDDSPEECEDGNQWTEYVRADLFNRLSAENAQQAELVASYWETISEQRQLIAQQADRIEELEAERDRLAAESGVLAARLDEADGIINKLTEENRQLKARRVQTPLNPSS